MRVGQANAEKPRVPPAELRKPADTDAVLKDVLLAVPQKQPSLLTEIISALEMVGAMLLMNREQVLWSGRGLGASSLVFFSSFFSTSVLSFGSSFSIKHQSIKCEEP